MPNYTQRKSLYQRNRNHRVDFTQLVFTFLNSLYDNKKERGKGKEEKKKLQNNPFKHRS
jgi:hypothetical protein